jgi:hypothetical protein
VIVDRKSLKVVGAIGKARLTGGHQMAADSKGNPTPLTTGRASSLGGAAQN